MEVVPHQTLFGVVAALLAAAGSSISGELGFQASHQESSFALNKVALRPAFPPPFSPPHPPLATSREVPLLAGSSKSSLESARSGDAGPSTRFSCSSFVIQHHRTLFLGPLVSVSIRTWLTVNQEKMMAQMGRYPCSSTSPCPVHVHTYGKQLPRRSSRQFVRLPSTFVREVEAHPIPVDDFRSKIHMSSTVASPRGFSLFCSNLCFTVSYRGPPAGGDLDGVRDDDLAVCSAGLLHVRRVSPTCLLVSVLRSGQCLLVHALACVLHLCIRGILFLNFVLCFNV